MSNDPKNPGLDPRLLGRMSRRQVLKAAGVGGAAVAALPLLSACGDDGGDGGTATTTGSDSGTGGGDIQKIKEYVGPVEDQFSGKGMTVDIGLVLAFTGPGAFFGRTMSAGAKLAAKHIEALGGPKFNFIDKDHKSGDPQAGVQAVKELGIAKVPVKLASYVDDLGAMTPGTTQFKMFTFDGGGGTSTFGKGKPYFWGTRAVTPNDCYPGIVKFLGEEMPDVKNVGALSWDLGPLNQINVDDLKKNLESGGLNLARQEFVAIGATDYSAQIQKLKAAKPDVIMLGIFGNDIGVFMKQYVTSGVNKPVICAEYTQASADVAGSAYNGLYLAFDFFDADKPNNDWSKIFIDEFKKDNKGTAPDYYAANYYEDTFGMWDVMRRVLKAGGDVKDGDAWDKAWREKPENPSVYGGDGSTIGKKVLSLETHSVTERPLTMSIFKDGKVQPLAYFNLEARDYRKA